ncbi:MAG: ATP-binding protein, partial [Bacteroidota bacterium]
PVRQAQGPLSGTAAAGAVNVDKSKVDSIVTNLIDNALKYTPEGGSVAVSCTPQESTWLLKVKDTGPGIPPEFRERIFARFARAPGDTASGTGIGLALARELAELLGGTLTLEDTPGTGACFALQLPLHPTKGPVPQPVESPRLHPEPAPTPKTKLPNAPLVLIVEDDPEVRAYLAESLSSTYRVLVAEDGRVGLDLAFREIPDLVVSDVMMPNLNGLQLCARLKNDRRTSHLPVLLLTAKSATEHRLEGLDRGADAYLSKPFAERELHLRLRNLLTLRDNTAARLREQLLTSGNQAPPEHTADVPYEAPFLQEARQLILARLDDPELAVADLEKGLGLSRSQLHRKLTATLGLSANKLINQLRLEKAAERLRQTTDPISTVAYDCGFRDVGYFGKRFRERYGESPTVYRSQVVK